MRQFTSDWFSLEEVQDSGYSLRDELLGAYQRTGRWSDRLNGQELPAAWAHLWTHFLELHRTRTVAAFGMNPITHEQVAAWRANLGRHVSAFEVECLLIMDAAARQEISRQLKADRDRQESIARMAAAKPQSVGVRRGR